MVDWDWMLTSGYTPPRLAAFSTARQASSSMRALRSLHWFNAFWLSVGSREFASGRTLSANWAASSTTAWSALLFEGKAIIHWLGTEIARAHF